MSEPRTLAEMHAEADRMLESMRARERWAIRQQWISWALLAVNGAAGAFLWYKAIAG